MPSDQMTRAVSPTMREAAAFVHWLRERSDYSGPHHDEAYGSPQLCESWRSSETRDSVRFVEIVELISGRTVCWCDDCGDPVWSGSFHGRVADGNEVCHRCLERYYWCDHCDGYYPDPHEHGSECEAPRQSFAFPLADGSTLRSDTTLTVETPAGLISEAGMSEVLNRLWSALNWYAYNVGIAPEWQTKDGNFTKRLAKLALQSGYKIPAPLLSDIGNIARAHSSSGNSHSVQLTRDLNQPASEFVHSSSCWWGSEWKSRCALKQEGGFAIRTFTDSTCYANVIGRAWVMPLSVERRGSGYHVELTEDSGSAGAFVVFNAYGPDGYEFARIVAQMRGWTYRKIAFQCNPMYVNSGGFLVAPAEVCAHVSDLCFDVGLKCGCE